MTPTVEGNWSLGFIYYFSGSLSGGEYPVSGVIVDSSGNLYGTALGGPGGLGVVYEITP